METYLQKRFAKKHSHRYFVDNYTGDAVCLSGEASHVEDLQGNHLNSIDYPNSEDIQIIWLGMRKQYPKINK